MGFTPTGHTDRRSARWAAGRVAIAGLSSLLFLAGGVATYVAPMLTPPLYIAGSVAMLANAVTAGLGSTRSSVGAQAGPRRWVDPAWIHRAGPGRPDRVLRLAAMAAIVATAFSAGVLT